jgi:hypothetical protein
MCHLHPLACPAPTSSVALPPPGPRRLAASRGARHNIRVDDPGGGVRRTIRAGDVSRTTPSSRSSLRREAVSETTTLIHVQLRQHQSLRSPVSPPSTSFTSRRVVSVSALPLWHHRTLERGSCKRGPKAATTDDAEPAKPATNTTTISLITHAGWIKSEWASAPRMSTHP